MKTLTVTALLCAVMALTTAAALPEEMSGEEPEERHLVKWSFFCPYGWTRYSGRCYRFISRAMSWGRAENNCLDLGGHLASVRNVLEYREIQEVITSADLSSPQTWVGGYNAQEVNQWFWSDGTRLDFTMWAPGEPNNYQGRQRCIQMNFGDGKAWDDVECWTERPSICAK
ncbi:ladderlectin-like [Pungitius pungitius]|uniref:ladderlectin-like n=1 Tax=Pungitius pungitius TaxID=134920 RepID=UPI002E0D0FA5